MLKNSGSEAILKPRAKFEIYDPELQRRRRFFMLICIYCNDLDKQIFSLIGSTKNVSGSVNQ